MEQLFLRLFVLPYHLAIALRDWIVVGIKFPRLLVADLVMRRADVIHPFADRAGHEGRAYAGDRVELTYGETPFATARELIAWASPTSGERFVDLGSGPGRVVLVAAALGLTAVGLEFLPSFVDLARHAARCTNLQQRAEFRLTDWRWGGWSDASIVFAAATLFSDDSLARLISLSETLAKGSRLIALSVPIVANHLHLIDRRSVWMSWGRVTAFLYARD